MRPKALSGSIAKYSRGLALSALTLIGASQAPGAIYYWDSNSTTDGFGNTTGAWGSALFLNTDITGAGLGPLTTATTNADTLNFGTATLNYAQASVTVSGAVAASSIVYGAGQTTGITISSGTSITLGNGTPGNGGITLNNGTGAQTISTPIVLNNSQSWTNNSSSNLTITGTVSGTGSTTLTNNGTGTNFVSLAGALQSTVGKIVQDSATSTLSLRGTSTAFTGNVEILKGTLRIGSNANNLGTSAGQVTLGASSGSDAATLEVIDNSSPTYVAKPIVLGTTTGTLTIRISDSTGTNTHTLTGAISGSNHLTLENAVGDDNLTFTTGAITNTGTITHIGAGSGDLTINSVIGNVAGVIQNSATSRMILAGANTSFAGTTTISAGILSLGNNSALGTSILTINGGSIDATATRAITNALSLGNNFTFVGTNTLTQGTGAVTLTATPVITTSASTLTLGGNIAGGTFGITKAGAGTLTLTAANLLYTGTTTINAGTLALSGAAGAIAASTTINLNGGTLTLTNTSASEALVNRVSNSASIISNGGSITVTNTASATTVYSETMGALDLRSGQLNVTQTNANSADVATQTLNFGSGSLTTVNGAPRTSATTSAINFSGASLGVNVRNTIKIVGQLATNQNEIIAPWATYGASDYAVYDRAGSANASTNSLGIQAAAIAASAQTAWSTDYTTGTGTLNNTLANASGSAANGKLSVTRNINTLRNTTTSTAVTATNATDVINLTAHGFLAGDVVGLGGITAPSGLALGASYYVINPTANAFQLSTTSGGAAALFSNDGNTVNIAGGITLGANNLGTLGILNGSTASLAIGSTGGAVTLPTTTAGNLYVTAGSGAISIDAPITNNTGALTLVKNGANVLTLTGTNTFSGGLTLNAGEVRVSSNASLGDTSGQITFAADSTLRVGIDSSANVASNRQINLNGGTASFTATAGPSSFTSTGKVTGSGAIRAFIPTGFVFTLNLNHASNDFTGAVIIDATNQGGNPDLTVNAFSLADAAGSGNIQFGRTQGSVNQRFIYTGTSDLTLNNRKIEFTATATTGTFNRSTLSSTQAAININTDLVVAAGASNQLTLDAPANVTSTFNGRLIDGTLSTLITKTGAGTWVLTNALNTYTGATTISAGTLQVSTLNNPSVAGPLGAAPGVGGLVLNGGTLRYTGGSVSTTRNFALIASSILDASGTAALNFTQAVVSPDQTLTANFLTTQKVVTGLSSTANLVVGMRVTGTNIAPSSTIQSIDSATQITLNNNTTGAGSGTSLGFGYTASARTLTLTGTNTDSNTIAGILQDTSAAGAGVLGLTKSGIGQWVLSGANTYSGTNTVNLGTLAGTQTSGTPFGTGAVTLNAGTLSLAPAGSGSNVTVTGGTVAAATKFTFNAGATLSLNKGSQTSLTYTFGTSGATWTRGTTAGNTGTLILSVGAIANLGAAAGSGERFLINGTAPTMVGTALLVDGVVAQDRGNSNVGEFVTYGVTNGFAAATPTLTNNFTGSLNTSYVNVTSPISTGTIAAHAVKVSGTTLTNSGTLTLGNGANTAGLILNSGIVSGGTLTTPAAAAEFVIYTSGTSEISSVIPTATGMIGMSVFGPGTLALTSGSANGFTGGLRINNTTVIATNDNQLGGTTSPITLTGGTLQTSGTFALGTTAQRAITLAAGQNQTGGTFNVTSGTTTYSNSATNSKFMSGSGSLTKTGAGILVLSGNTTNTYTGLTTVDVGTLEVTVNSALGTNAAGTSVTAGATLKLTGVNYSTAEGLIINGTGVSSGGALASSGTSTFAGLITAATSATINAISGTLALSGGLVKDGTTLTFTGAGAFTISSVISGASANSDLVVDATTVTLTAANTYNGPTTITNGGTLITNALGALPLSPRSAVSFTGTGTSALNLGANQVVASLSSAGAATVALGSNTLTVGITGGNTTFAGSIGGAGNLIKDTNSKQVLSGSNGYTGTTTVSAGTLEVTGSLSGTTAVTVSTGGTLLMNGGSNNVGTGDRAPVASSQTISGTVAGANFTGSGGTLAVAQGAGGNGTTHSFNQMTLTANSTLDFSSGAGTTNTNVNLIFASLNSATKTALTGTPTLTLTIANWSGPQYSPGDTVDSSLTGFGDGRDRLIFTTDPGFGFGSFIAGINFTGFGAGATQVAFGSGFEIVPVPEPATTALIGSIALCALIGYRERRRFTGLGKRTAARK